MQAKIKEIFMKTKLEFTDKKTEEEYIRFRKEEIQLNVKAYLKIMSVAVFVLFIIARDWKSFCFAIYGSLLYIFNE